MDLRTKKFQSFKYAFREAIGEKGEFNIGDEIGFMIGEKHFVLRRDE